MIVCNYVTDIGMTLNVVPVSIISENPIVTYDWIKDNEHLPIEIDNLFHNSINSCKILRNSSLRSLRLITPDNIEFSITSPIPFREIDLQQPIDKGYKVYTQGERIGRINLLIG